MIDPPTLHPFAASGGLELRRYRWAAERPERAIAIVHGLVEHAGRYDAFARWLAARGCVVHAFDQRGHGRSEGRRAYAPSFGHLLDDIERFLAEVEHSEPGLDIALLGHSLGGLEVTRLLAERGSRLSSRVRAAVLSGAALGPTPGGARVALANVLSRVWPQAPIPRPVDPHGISSDPEVVRAYCEDPLVGRRITARLGAELLAAMDGAVDLASRIDRPVLVLHGEADPICAPDASRAFAAGLLTEGSELRTWPGMRHEILNEVGREQVYAELLEWVEKHVPAASAEAER